MKRIAHQNKDDVEFVFVAEHYDHHISGLCRYEGKLCEFRALRDTYSLSSPRLIYEIFSLNLREKTKWLCRKKLFEVCVGKHWTYPHRGCGAEFVRKKPFWLHTLLLRIYYRIIP